MTSEGLPELRRGTYTLTFDQLSFYQFLVFAVPPPHKGEVHRRLNPSTIFPLIIFFFFSSLSLSPSVSRLGGGRCSDIDRACEVRHLRVPTYV